MARFDSTLLHTSTYSFLGYFLLLVLLFFAFFSPSITGNVISENGDMHSISMNLTLPSDSSPKTIPLSLHNVTSFGITGDYIGNGTVHVTLSNETHSWTVLKRQPPSPESTQTKPASRITGFVVADTAETSNDTVEQEDVIQPTHQGDQEETSQEDVETVNDDDETISSDIGDGTLNTTDDSTTIETTEITNDTTTQPQTNTSTPQQTTNATIETPTTNDTVSNETIPPTTITTNTTTTTTTTTTTNQTTPVNTTSESTNTTPVSLNTTISVNNTQSYNTTLNGTNTINTTNHTLQNTTGTQTLTQQNQTTFSNESTPEIKEETNTTLRKDQQSQDLGTTYEFSFDEYCEDTCSLPPLHDLSVTVTLEGEGELFIEEIVYTTPKKNMSDKPQQFTRNFSN